MQKYPQVSNMNAPRVLKCPCFLASRLLQFASSYFVIIMMLKLYQPTSNISKSFIGFWQSNHYSVYDQLEWLAVFQIPFRIQQKSIEFYYVPNNCERIEFFKALIIVYLCILLQVKQLISVMPMSLWMIITVIM